MGLNKKEKKCHKLKSPILGPFLVYEKVANYHQCKNNLTVSKNAFETLGGHFSSCKSLQLGTKFIFKSNLEF